MYRRVVPATSLLVLSIFLLLPAGAAAQTGSIAGQVADETGGVLPGVTVEATSPALIEGVRTAFTDGSGLYTLEALRPGTYTITFTLPGFSTFIREGIEIVTGFSANVDATMTVGAVEETVTVSGASPVIDVQNVVHQENISNETLDILPTGRTYSGYAALTVGAQTDILGGGQDVGGSVGDTWGTVIIHGSATYDGEVMWDGMSVTASVTSGGGTGKMFFANQAAVEEVVMATGGMDAETGFGAIAMNYIPREGGNAFSFFGIATGANENMQALNWNESLGARGLDESQVQGLKKNWDWGAGFGGPIVRDRLWFYTAHRWWGSQTYATGSYHNGAPRDMPYGRGVLRARLRPADGAGEHHARQQPPPDVAGERAPQDHLLACRPGPLPVPVLGGLRHRRSQRLARLRLLGHPQHAGLLDLPGEQPVAVRGRSFDDQARGRPEAAARGDAQRRRGADREPGHQHQRPHVARREHARHLRRGQQLPQFHLPRLDVVRDRVAQLQGGHDPHPRG